MTGYHVTIGYNSAWSTDEVKAALLAYIETLRREPSRILNEVLRLEPELADVPDLVDFAEPYQHGQDLTLKVIDEPEHFEIYQAASGSGRSRDLKESFRRAVARLLIEHLHRQKMEVSFTVG